MSTTTTTTSADAGARRYPRRIASDGGEIELRLLAPGDADALLAFARRLAPHDLLFLPRDISEPKVVAAWVDAARAGTLFTLLATRAGEIHGCATIASDPLSWSRHVGELRVIVDAALRGQGLGQKLTQEAFAVALETGLEKLTAQMTVDQRGAIAVFEGLGFKRRGLAARARPRSRRPCARHRDPEPRRRALPRADDGLRTRRGRLVRPGRTLRWRGRTLGEDVGDVAAGLALDAVDPGLGRFGRDADGLLVDAHEGVAHGGRHALAVAADVDVGAAGGTARRGRRGPARPGAARSSRRRRGALKNAGRTLTTPAASHAVSSSR